MRTLLDLLRANRAEATALITSGVALLAFFITGLPVELLTAFLLAALTLVTAKHANRRKRKRKTA